MRIAAGSKEAGPYGRSHFLCLYRGNGLYQTALWRIHAASWAQSAGMTSYMSSPMILELRTL